MNEVEAVARAKLIDELALALDQFLSHQVERDTLACDLTQDELTELATGLAAIAAVYAPRLAELEAEVERLREALKDVASRANAHVSRTALGASHDA